MRIHLDNPKRPDLQLEIDAREEVAAAVAAMLIVLRNFRLTGRQALKALRSVGERYVDKAPNHHRMMMRIHAEQRKENAARDKKRKAKILAKPESERTPVELTILKRLDEQELMRKLFRMEV